MNYFCFKHSDFDESLCYNQNMIRVNVCTFFFIAFVLCGCEQRKTPLKYVYVSSKPYVCRGARYVPQKYYEYDKVGLASWYGRRDGCDGKKKATGERFNSMELTAAHRTLPLPCVVKVTNLRNNKSIVVVVDDRGPYKYKNRLIDLSYMSAKILDLHRYRPSKVRVQTIVSDSLRLAKYISEHCKKRKDPHGRSWAQLYFQKIVR